MFWEHNIYRKCFCVLIGKLTAAGLAAEIGITAKAVERYFAKLKE